MVVIIFFLLYHYKVMQKSEYDSLRNANDDNEVDMWDLRNQEGKTFKEKVEFFVDYLLIRF